MKGSEVDNVKVYQDKVVFYDEDGEQVVREGIAGRQLVDILIKKGLLKLEDVDITHNEFKKQVSRKKLKEV